MCPRETDVMILDFSEKLGMAVRGDTSAYAQICAPFVDCLFTTAYITLKISDDAFDAVLSAVKDGYEGVSGVKDELHLKAWLVRELTKNTVKKLKEYKAGNIGIPSAPHGFQELAGLSDIERLVLAISLAGKYNPHEIALITGLTDELVNSKLGSAEEKLGWAFSSVAEKVRSFTAPERLQKMFSEIKENSVEELPASETQSGDNELFSYFSDSESSSSDTENDGAFTPDNAGYYGDSEDNDDGAFTPQNTEYYGDSEDNDGGAFTPQNTEYYGDSEENDSGAFTPQNTEYYADSEDNDGGAFTPQNTEYYKDSEDNDSAFSADNSGGKEDSSSFAAVSPDTSVTEDDYDEPVFVQEDETEEDEAGENDPGEFDPELNAETFIAAVSAERIKGSEFLRLIGNTRISNSVYREIEQNPGLTRKRLIHLLEQSPLTPKDYYKLFTALKQRRELLEEKEEKRMIHEKAGLYDGSRRRRSEKKQQEEEKSDLQKALEEAERQKKALTFQEAAAAKEREKAEEPAYAPQVETEDEDTPDLDAEISGMSKSAFRDFTSEHFRIDIFSDLLNNDIEAVDPFQAIAAQQTLPPAKPSPKDEWDIPGSEADISRKQELDEREAVRDDSSTMEFDMGEEKPNTQSKPLTMSAEFDIVDPNKIAEDSAPKSQKPLQLDSEPQKKANAPLPEKKPVAQKTGKENAPAAEKPGKSMNLELDGFVAGAAEDGKSTRKNPSKKLEFGFEPDTGQEKKKSVPDKKPISPDKPAARSLTIEDNTEKPPRGFAINYDMYDEDYEDENDDSDADGEKADTDFEKKTGGAPNKKLIIICAVCAVLLAAGGLIFKLLSDRSTQPQPQTAPVSSESVQTEDTRTAPDSTPEQTNARTIPAELTSVNDLYDAALLGTKESPFPSEYLRADGSPYAPALCERVCVTDNDAYILSDKVLRCIALDPNAPAQAGTLKMDTSTEFIGFNSDGTYLYALFTGEKDGRPFVRTYIFDREMNLYDSYTQDGSFVNADFSDGRMILLTSLTAEPETADLSVTRTFAPAYIRDKKRYTLKLENVHPLEGAVYGTYTVIGAVSGKTTKLSAFIGGYTSYASFDGSSFTLLIPDENKTYVRKMNVSGKDVTVAESSEYRGEAFDAACLGGGCFVGYSGDGIVTAIKNGISCSRSINDELPCAAALSESGIYYVLTKKDQALRLYGFDVSGNEPIETNVSAESVYTDKLRSAGTMLAGLKAEPDETGNRTGLRLSLYSYRRGLTEKAYSIIGLDASVSAENLKYLQSDAETDSGFIASDASGTRLAVSSTYFDGFSQVHRVVTLHFDGDTVAPTGAMLLYDIGQDSVLPVIKGDTLYIITKDKIITANVADCSKISEFPIEKQE